MSLCRHLFVYFVIHNLAYAREQKMYIVSNHLNENLKEDLSILLEQTNGAEAEKVTIQLYYESLCPDCIQFYTTAFTPVVDQLSQYLNIQTYPYGNAKTTEHNGHYQFKCQHGPKECYGNKLHACAIDSFQNMTRAALFNSCMMDPRHVAGSDDDAADACGKSQNIAVTSIKECAKGSKGVQLLKYYGDESKKAHFKYVPYILINRKLNDGDNFMKDVCKEFLNPPPPCQDILKHHEKSNTKK